MRLQYLALPLACASLLGACAFDRTEPAEPNELVTVEPVSVEQPAARAEKTKITRYADENRDGYVTRAEAKADPNLAASFDKYDANDDGKLDRAEFARLEGANAGAQSSSRQVASKGPSGSEEWMTDQRPDGYFGPGTDPRWKARGDSLNRTGADR